ncbi:MAG: BolA family transcriptional regulator [Pseudomonadales bacterium]|nr:BolA family transcriptional regulator [Caldilineaceae bacterium]MCP5179401.1 BolA family transcriptional regulator [Pseudomonadales bacterium]MCP5185375.1 BolA family transcriptional regulator [Pseudomonadales bacterium]
MGLSDELQVAIENGLQDAEVALVLEGNKLLVEVVSPEFSGLSRVQRSKRVYQILDDYIRSGTLHAVTIRARAPGENG